MQCAAGGVVHRSAVPGKSRHVRALPRKSGGKKKGPTGAVGLTLRDWILKWAAR